MADKKNLCAQIDTALHKPLEQLCQELLQEQDVPIQEMQL